jgi:hypothetical protein
VALAVVALAVAAWLVMDPGLPWPDRAPVVRPGVAALLRW